MFDTTLKCANIDVHKQLAQQVAYTTAILPNNVNNEET